MKVPKYVSWFCALSIALAENRQIEVKIHHILSTFSSNPGTRTRICTQNPSDLSNMYVNHFFCDFTLETVQSLHENEFSNSLILIFCADLQDMKLLYTINKHSCYRKYWLRTLTCKEILTSDTDVQGNIGRNLMVSMGRSGKTFHNLL